MSGQPGNNGDFEPLSKRQKRGDCDRTLALGGPMYDEATARKMLQEVVLVLAEYTEDGEAVIGFDPDDVSLDNVYYVNNGYFGRMDVTPMIYFSRKGKLKMCRYLASRGASTTKMATAWCPMYAAARGGHLEVCQFLHANGASDDIWKETYMGWTPFHAAISDGHDEVVRWLVLQGALCADGSSEEIEVDLNHPEALLPGTRKIFTRACKRLVEWAKEVTESHFSLMMFLLGALPPASGKNQSCILQCFSGHPGVRKHIGDFVGLEVTKGKHLRILRNVVEVLPSFIIRTDDEE